MIVDGGGNSEPNARKKQAVFCPPRLPTAFAGRDMPPADPWIATGDQDGCRRLDPHGQWDRPIQKIGHPRKLGTRGNQPLLKSPPHNGLALQ